MSVTGADEEGLTAEQRSRRDDIEFGIEDPDDVSDGPWDATDIIWPDSWGWPESWEGLR